jgi:serine phosphatase RsbU (regulator of sigma subunit)
MSARHEDSAPMRAAPDSGEGWVRLQLGRMPLWKDSRSGWMALALGLAVTAALALTSLAVYHRNERRLLHLRLRELSLVLADTVPSLEQPLASAAELAVATNGSAQEFRAFMAPYVGHGHQFASASLWRLDGPRPRQIALVGSAQVVGSQPRAAAELLARAPHPGVLNLIGLLGSPRPGLGFELTVTAPSRTRRFGVYAENPLPANRRSAIERNSAFSDLDYALYLGHSQRSADLLVTNVKHLPIGGRRASDAVPFGSSALTLVVAPKGSLGGTFFSALPWIIAGVGVLLAIAAALLTDRLARGRHRAERLAGMLDRVAAENRAMYREERSISQTLQHALLPDKMPKLEGLRVSAMYVPAASGIEVGGDWYDVVAVDERRAVLIIGDVSGHGLEAAITMAMLRHAALAYVAQDCAPASVLAKLAEFVQGTTRGYFATVLCALIEAEAHRLTLASAGHMPPLLLDDGHSRFIDLRPGVAIGAGKQRSWDYRQATTTVAPRATLIAFTDGLVERRSEVLDVGLARLKDLASGQELPLDELLAKLTRELNSDEHEDDTAIVGVQWQS